MSRGHGRIQRQCMDVIAQAGDSLDSIEIAGRALRKNRINESEHVSFRRALRKLCDEGLIVDLGRAWRRGRRHWALPEVAIAYCERLGNTFGNVWSVRERRRAQIAGQSLFEYVSRSSENGTERNL